MKRTLSWPGAFALVTLMTVFSIAAAAEKLYRWVDADGNVHYSDQAPPDGARETRSLNQARSDSVGQEDAAESASYVDQEAEFQKRREQQTERNAKAKKNADTVAAWDRNCKVARSNLQALTDPTGGRVRQPNAQGELMWLSAQQVAQQKTQASEDIKKWCKG